MHLKRKRIALDKKWLCFVAVNNSFGLREPAEEKGKTEILPKLTVVPVGGKPIASPAVNCFGEKSDSVYIPENRAWPPIPVLDILKFSKCFKNGPTLWWVKLVLEILAMKNVLFQ
ncbi:hypothetical protein CDAR_98241 [Caerostris darwini]|uniref:Uncharacterized protein n=1 Tax=Caerostris darwini TaxID=1538125 RepID=A0AAV4UFT1_9ARAC|nr:hypothetical protein CDAR_98241 [Caerostris darwini]